MPERDTGSTVHGVTWAILWVVLAILAGTVLYAGWIAVANWKHIGV